MLFRSSGSFKRGSGALTKDGNVVEGLVGTLTGAAVLMVANAITNNIDIQVSGLAATVVWNLGIDLTYNI